MAEELVDECCSFETDITELYEKGKHRKRTSKFAPLTVPAGLSDAELEKLTPEMRALLGYNPNQGELSQPCQQLRNG